jgi:demethylmenaquinone methyltransferase/2-methoxy-6-polyprenyl-1,4-benzoquinol methylase
MTKITVEERIWDESRLADPHGQPDKALRVRAMFDAIAPRYERVNRVLSAGRDASWRRRAVAMAHVDRADRVLDLGCGTGDFARAFAQAGPSSAVGCDFSRSMLALAAKRNSLPISWCQADAMCLPFAEGAFSVVSCAFSVRNFLDLALGLREMHRVLVPGGRAVILEFSIPRSLILRSAYLVYMRRILPRVAAALSGERLGAYRYLAESVRHFVDTRGMIDGLSSAGFGRVEHRRLTGGIVTVFVAWKDGRRT